MNRFVAHDLWDICWGRQLASWQKSWQKKWQKINHEYSILIGTTAGGITCLIDAFILHPLNFRNLVALGTATHITHYKHFYNSMTVIGTPHLNYQRLNVRLPDRYCYSNGGLANSHNILNP